MLILGRADLCLSISLLPYRSLKQVNITTGYNIKELNNICTICNVHILMDCIHYHALSFVVGTW